SCCNYALIGARKDPQAAGLPGSRSRAGRAPAGVSAPDSGPATAARGRMWTCFGVGRTRGRQTRWGMAEPPAAWAAPGAPAPEATAAIRPVHLRRPEATGDGGTSLRPIALRPLTVLELIDGAIGAVRAVPTALLGWASLLVVALALAD